MRDYKLVLILKSDLKKDKIEAISKNVQNWIGKVEDFKSESMGDRKLAYPVKKQRTGEYSILNFKAETIPTDLNTKMRMQEDVLRFLLVRE